MLKVQSKEALCSLPEECDESPCLAVDAIEWSAPTEAVWHGTLDGKSFVLAL